MKNNLSEKQIERRKKLLDEYGSLSGKSTNGSKGNKRPGGPGFGGPGPKGPGSMHVRNEEDNKSLKETKDSVIRIFKYIGKDKYKVFFVLFSVLVSSIANLIGSYMIKPVIDIAADSGLSGEVRIKKISFLILIMGFIYLVGVIFNFLQQKIMIIVSQSALLKIRKDLFGNLQKLPIKYYDTHSKGEIMGRFTNDLETVGEMLNNTIVQIITGVVTLVGTVILMFATNWILAIVTIGIVPVLGKVVGFLGNITRKYYKYQQSSLGAVNGYIEEMITGQKVVKIFCHEEEAVNDFELLSDNLRENQIKAQFFGGIMGPVMGNLSQIGFAVTATVGSFMCINNWLSIGGLAMFTNYSKQFARPINELSMQVNTIFSALAGAERVFEIIDEDQEKIQDLEVDDIELKGNVELRNVSFGYEADTLVLKGVSVKGEKGKKIAFVGSTGAGKTTITNLINRFYDVTEGNIYIDGIDIKKLSRRKLRENIAMVLQDTHLFTGTVLENIRYGRLDATDEEVVEAAKTASAHSFIMKLENGYETVLEGDGANLSQGQRQLLNIARAAISKAPILVLDEATSSVDTRTEKHIEAGMERIMKNRTTFVIAHRLSTVRDSDMILVLEHGEIIEQGNHFELIKDKGRYYDLYNGDVQLD